MKFAVGDIVQVARKVLQEDGWKDYWVPYMDEFVENGREYEVVGVESRGVTLKDCASRLAIMVPGRPRQIAFPHGSLKLV